MMCLCILAVLPQTTPEQLIRLRNRASRHINFYMQHTPDYFIGMALMCICKLDLLNLIEAAMNEHFRARSCLRETLAILWLG